CEQDSVADQVGRVRPLDRVDHDGGDGSQGRHKKRHAEAAHGLVLLAAADLLVRVLLIFVLEPIAVRAHGVRTILPKAFRFSNRRWASAASLIGRTESRTGLTSPRKR